MRRSDVEWSGSSISTNNADKTHTSQLHNGHSKGSGKNPEALRGQRDDRK